jgi:hypothetical protein
MKKIIILLMSIMILTACDKANQVQLSEDFVKNFSGYRIKIESIHEFIQSINYTDSDTYRSFLSKEAYTTKVPKVNVVSANFQLEFSTEDQELAYLQLITEDHQKLLFRIDVFVELNDPAPKPIFTPIEIREPDYIDETKYSGNERDVVRTINLFMKYSNLDDDQSQLGILSTNHNISLDYIYPMVHGIEIDEFQFKDNDQTSIVYTTIDYDGEGKSSRMIVLFKETNEWKVGIID